MIRLNILLLSIFFSTISCHGQKKINGKDFGLVADGKTDNSEALSNLFQYCVEQNATCYIPKKKNAYVVTKPIYVDVSNGKSFVLESDGAELLFSPSSEGLKSDISLWRLSPVFLETCMLSIGKTASSSTLENSFKDSRNNKAIISGINIRAGQAMSNVPDRVFSAIDISTDFVDFSGVSISGFRGYGIRSYGAHNLNFDKIKIVNISGRYKESDSFGDALYIAVLKPNATVFIKNSKFKGELVNNTRARIGLTFEYSQYPYRAEITNTDISDFAKAIHVEEKAISDIVIQNSRLYNFNYGIAMVANKNATCTILNSRIDCGTTDGLDEGAGGPTINTDGGGVYRFYNCSLNLNGIPRSYITAVNVELFDNCVIDGNNKNPYFGDGNTLFNKCTFKRFGGKEFSFFAYGSNISDVELRNCKAISGQLIHARSQRVNLQITGNKKPANMEGNIFGDTGN